MGARDAGTNKDATSEIDGYVDEEPPPEAGVFEIGLVLAGAVSAGAYTAGVLDFLIEALDAWEAAKAAERQAGKDPSEWAVPSHRVRLRVIAGASAGSMNAAIAAVALRYDFPHVQGGAQRSTSPSPNPFYRAWVQAIDISSLLGDEDLRRDPAMLSSILDSSVLERITDDALDFRGPVLERPYLDRRLRIILTQASLRGIPYYLPLPGTSDAGLGMWLHKTYRSFSSHYGEGPARRRPDDVSLAYPNGHEDAYWKELGNAALGSGAFPVGLAPRLEVRGLDELSYRFVSVPNAAAGGAISVQLKPAWRLSDSGTAPMQSPSFDEFVVDGGTMDNEPLDFARAEIAGLVAQNPREGDKANRAIIMIDPFPDTPADMDAHKSGRSGNLFAVMLGLVGAWKNQARFNPVELALALDEKVYSRYLIAPSRRRFAGDRCEDSNGFDIACGALGGFGGFLHESLRHHDYLLGRRNCQAFLARYLTLPSQNPLFSTWSPGLKETYARQNGGAASAGELPIIPLTAAVLKEEPLPPWPTEPIPLDRIKGAFTERAGNVAGRALDMANISWWKRKLAAVGVSWVRDTLVDRVAAIVEKDLRARNLNASYSDANPVTLPTNNPYFPGS